MVDISNMPDGYKGRWFYDEDSTTRDWPARAANQGERIRFKIRGLAMKRVRLKLKGNPYWYFDIDACRIISHDNIRNPQFDLLSLSEGGGATRFRARQIQLPGDDTPKEVTLKLRTVNEALSFELWEKGALQVFYVLNRAKRIQRPDPPPPEDFTIPHRGIESSGLMLWLISLVIKVPHFAIRKCVRRAEAKGLPLTYQQLSAHYLAGGRNELLVDALVYAQENGIKITTMNAMARDLYTAHGSKVSLVDHIRSFEAAGFRDLDSAPLELKPKPPSD
jgi:hypothetical protein